MRSPGERVGVAAITWGVEKTETGRGRAGVAAAVGAPTCVLQVIQDISKQDSRSQQQFWMQRHMLCTRTSFARVERP